MGQGRGETQPPERGVQAERVSSAELSAPAELSEPPDRDAPVDGDAPPDRDAPADRPGRAVVAALGANLAGVLPMFLTGAMAVQIGRDLGFGATGVGLLSGSFALTTMLGSAPLGGRVGVLGVRRSLRLAGLISAVALLGAAVAPGFGWLAAALVLAGLANAVGQPAGNATLAQHVSADRFGIAFAVKQSGIPVATLLGGLAVPTVALTIGWRWAFVMAALLAVGAGLLPPPDRPPATRRVEGQVPRSQRSSLWALAAGLSLAVVAAASIGAFGASGAVAIGLSEAAAGVLVAAGGLAGLTIRLGAGLLADRVAMGALAAVAGLIAVGALGWALMALAFATDAAAPYVVGLLIANAFGWGWPGLLHLAVARQFPTATAAASGRTQTGVSAGLLLGSPVLGLVIGLAGWTLAWSVAACSALVAAVLVLVLRPRLGEG
jgi:predicted MFS family arabinose efflux permease